MESVEVLFFDSWLTKEGEVSIPVSATMWPANAVPPKGVSPSRSDGVVTIRYDQSAETLALELRPPLPGQLWSEICEGVSAVLNSETGLIQGLEIRSFKARVAREGKIVLPVNATLRPVKHAVAAD